MRGEDGGRRGRWVWRLGSPPHARGRHRLKLGGRQQRDITPACAGKTRLQGRREGKPRDHPRMRGEDRRRRRAPASSVGSPPHARGRRRSRTFPTPASPDHPRMRGEDRHTCLRHTWQNGSPPHARGRPRTSSLRSGTFGITPACAGKTRDNNVFGGSSQDHPRMRGEDSTGLPPRKASIGSPPHARGRRNT